MNYIAFSQVVVPRWLQEQMLGLSILYSGNSQQDKLNTTLPGGHILKDVSTCSIKSFTNICFTPCNAAAVAYPYLPHTVKFPTSARLQPRKGSYHADLHGLYAQASSAETLTYISRTQPNALSVSGSSFILMATSDHVGAIFSNWLCNYQPHAR